MSPLWVAYRSMTSRFPPFAFVELISPYNKKNITHWLRTISHSFASLTREILFLPLEHKIHIFSPPCNILYIYHFWQKRSLRFDKWYPFHIPSLERCIPFCKCKTKVKPGNILDFFTATNSSISSFRSLRRKWQISLILLYAATEADPHLFPPSYENRSEFW